MTGIPLCCDIATAPAVTPCGTSTLNGMLPAVFRQDFAAMTNLPTGYTFTRASSAGYWNASGLWTLASPGTPRFGAYPDATSPVGLIVEESRTNSLRNSSTTGAVVGTLGSGGARPTNWAVEGTSSLSQDVVSIGTENGMDYVDLRFYGTATATSYRLRFDNTFTIVAAPGEVWSSSVYCKLVNGSLSNIAGVSLRLEERSSGGGTLYNAYHSAIVPTTTLQRFTQTCTIAHASAQRVINMLYLTLTIGLSVDVTLRLYLPQLEKGAFASSAIRTTGSAATRAADVVTYAPLSPWLNPAEGHLSARCCSFGAQAGAGIASLSDGSVNNRISLYGNLGSGQLGADVVAGGVAQADLTGTSWSHHATHNLCLAWKTNAFACCANGGSLSTDASGTLPAVSQLDIGRVAGSANEYFNGTILTLSVGDVRPPDDSLPASTV